jgi:hypothetical protein
MLSYQLFDFNKSTGVVSNFIDLPTSTNTGFAYGLSFSPDNSKLYIWGVAPSGLDQFDLSSGNSNDIISSRHHVTYNGPYSGTGLQLANNGKIYVCQPSNYFGVINSPNLAGDACHFVGQAIATNIYYSLPSFIDSYQYKNGLAVCDVGITESNLADEITIAPNPFSNTLIIQSKTNLEQVNITLSNCIGLPIKQMTSVSGNNFSINRAGLANGIYFLQIIANGKVIKHEKVLVQ